MSTSRFVQSNENGFLRYILNHPGIVSKAVGITFLILATSITLINKCPTNGQFLTIYILFGAGMALLFAESAKESIVKFSVYNIVVTLVGGVALPFLLFMLNPIERYTSDGCRFGAVTTVTVTVHGKKGLNELVLQGRGKVVMNIPKEIKKQPINEEGQASFANLRIGDSVSLDIEFSEPYHPIYPNKKYVITPNDNIYLLVSLEGLGKIYGTVLFADTALPGVNVRIEGPIDSLRTVTNEEGRYEINIPEALQNREYTVWYVKKGFKSKTAKAYPQVGKPMDILMEEIQRKKRK